MTLTRVDKTKLLFDMIGRPEGLLWTNSRPLLEICHTVSARASQSSRGNLVSRSSVRVAPTVARRSADPAPRSKARVGDHCQGALQLQVLALQAVLEFGTLVL